MDVRQLSFEEYHKMMNEQREAKRAEEAAANKPSEGGISDYLRRLREERHEDSDYLNYIMLKDHEKRKEEEKAKEEAKAERDRLNAFISGDKEVKTDRAYHELIRSLMD